MGLPLKGVRVIDLGWVWSGPYASTLMAFMGADVIKVESHERMCSNRLLPPFPEGKRLPPEIGGGFFAAFNQSKRSITLNLKHPNGLAAAKKLITSSEVVLSNYAAGVIERLGLGYQVLKELKPSIILCCMSGFGEHGPYKDFVAFGQGQATMSGFARLSGALGEPPRNSGFMLANPFAGVHGTFAALAALRHQRKTGEGQFIDMSQWEATLQLMGEGMLARQLTGEEPWHDGNRDTTMSPHGIFRCKDMEGVPGAKSPDQWVSIACRTETQWEALTGAMDQPDLADDPRFATLSARRQNEDELEERIGSWTRPQDPHDCARKLQRAGVPAAVCATQKDLFEDAGMMERGFLGNITHPAFGTRLYPGAAWSFAGAPRAVRGPSPILGQHTDEVLSELGYGSADIEAMHASGGLS